MVYINNQNIALPNWMCIRFKKAESIPFALIVQLMKKMGVGDWIEAYEKAYKS